MSRYTFLFRRKDNDRNCCAYIESQPRFECDHYFGSVILHGAGYSNSNFPEYEDIDTVLTEDEYQRLIEYNKQIKDLGYGIKKGDKRYNKGLALYEEYKDIFDKLQSDEAIEFQENIIEEEKEWLMVKYDFSDDDVETIFDNYGLDYRDRGIVGYVYGDATDVAEEIFNECLCLEISQRNALEGYVDFEQMGKDIANSDEVYCLLDDDRVVRYNM